MHVCGYLGCFHWSISERQIFLSASGCITRSSPRKTNMEAEKGVLENKCKEIQYKPSIFGFPCSFSTVYFRDFHAFNKFSDLSRPIKNHQTVHLLTVFLVAQVNTDARQCLLETKWHLASATKTYLTFYHAQVVGLNLMLSYGGFQKLGAPQNGWYIMENPIKIYDLGVPLFSKTIIYNMFCMEMNVYIVSYINNFDDHPGTREVVWILVCRVTVTK